MESKRDKANEIIQTHVMWASGAGAVPIPLLDIAAVTAVQMDMLKQLCRLYEIDFNESSGKSLISAVAGSTLARIGASFIKSIPGVGSLLGGMSMSILSGASTYGMGQVFTSQFEAGNGLFNFDMNRAKKEYDEQYEKGKEYASNLQKKDEKPDKGEVFKKLDELLNLKKSGILTEDEFNKKKEDLLKKL
jgi:uncharacterized protein (DUF697 family)